MKMQLGLPAVFTEFERGPRGEIIPPPLIEGDEDDILARFIGENATMITNNNPAEMETLKSLALIFDQQKQLIRVFGSKGGYDFRDRIEYDLWTLVVKGQQPISLRMLGDNTNYNTFYPVLQFINPDRNMWRFGIMDDDMKHKDFISEDPAEAFKKACEIFDQFCRDEI